MNIENSCIFIFSRLYWICCNKKITIEEETQLVLINIFKRIRLYKTKYPHNSIYTNTDYTLPLPIHMHNYLYLHKYPHHPISNVDAIIDKILQSTEYKNAHIFYIPIWLYQCHMATPYVATGNLSNKTVLNFVINTLLNLQTREQS